MKRRISHVVTAAAVVGLSASLATSAGAATPAADSSAAAVDTVSADASSTLAAGQVLDANGAPVASATVAAYAFPSQAVMRGLKNPGDSFELTPVGQTTSDKSGHFKLKPDYGQLGSQQRTKATDPVNVQIIVDSPSGWSSYGSTLRFDAEGKATIDVPKDANASAASALAATTDSAAAATHKTVASAAAGGVMSLDVALTPGALSQDAVATGAVAADGVVALSATPGSNCSLVTNYGARWAAVGEMASTVSGYTGQFQYSAGSSSTLGYGTSSTGAYGTYSVGGTASLSSTSTIGYPTYSTAASNLMFTQWTYGKFKCIAPTSGMTWYNVFPMDFVSGAKAGASGTPTGSYCASYMAGSTFTKSSTNAVTWTNGVDISGIIGIALSIKTGFTNTAKLHYTFPTARQLCGWQDYPPGTPYRLVVH